MNTYTKFASVILDVAVDKVLDYGIPVEFLDKIACGVRVEVPLHGRPSQGYVVDVKNNPSFSNIKPILNILSNESLISKDLFQLACWMAKYYCTPLRKILKIMVPSSVRDNTKQKQQRCVMRAKTKEELQAFCIEIRNKFPAQAAVLDVMLQVKKRIFLSELLEQTQGTRSPVDSLVKKGFLAIDLFRPDASPLINEQYIQSKAKKLNPQQAEAFARIANSLNNNSFETHLLFGVTGSGKTEVYLQAIELALQQGKSTIMLVPEIALTTQTIERFKSRFKEHIAIIHHRLSAGERNEDWQKIQRGETKIIVGARSALFSPVPNLGLIIVDEEHETSYKQHDEMPCYHARDTVVMRGKICSSTVILGSATPSLESYYNVKKGKYSISILKDKAAAAFMSKITVVDMRKEYEKTGYTNFSEALLEGIKIRQEKGEQTILFLNRRGYHTTLFCKQCSKPIQCNHCDVALTLHKGEHSLACHLCGYTIPPPTCCPKCQQSEPLKYRGVGTEQIEKALHAIFPNIRTLRIDADTTKHKGSHQKLFRAFATGKADVLIGTQMVAKGLHFPQVTLVGIINSDSGLNIPDFRASETAFQLITQVSGRAGRESMQGEVIIQSCIPENSTIQLAAQQDYTKFYEEEIAIREMFKYPPVFQMAKVLFVGSDAKKTEAIANDFRNQLLALLPQNYEITMTLPSGYAKIKDKYRFQFFIRGPQIGTITNALEKMQANFKKPSQIHIKIDINPTSTYF